ncbi:DUF11 domain-containing protein [Telmatocola sphagniphila]|uniref:DUF11 domain-containing protein n=1 Tax=Telmatocola sphagniphila TaxID=1123043 RepID=A0A8E6B4H6_9BACT|nr:DUF11 domain-containing protein [Telmatocola sphagniphila]QVL30966.1 DUF11 domain-containing protein [Telmatocola sphagniphila]
MIHKWTRTAAVATCLGVGLVGWATFSKAQPPSTSEPTLPAIPVLPKQNLTIPTSGLPKAPPSLQVPEPDVTLPSISPSTPQTKPADPTLKPLTIEPITDPRDAKKPEPAKTLMVTPTTPAAIKPIEPSPLKEDPIELKPTPSMTLGSPAPMSMGVISKQDPSIALEWTGNQAVKLGQPTDYVLHVKNTCPSALQKVVVQVRLPKEVTVGGVEPKPEMIEGVMLWELGTVMPKQDKQLRIKMTTLTKGDLNCQAWVTFTGSSTMKLMVREPKLAVKASAPEKVLMGDPANITLTISNPGDSTTDSVKLVATLGEGLEGVRGNKMMQEIGSLAAGETRTIQLPCVSKAGGMQKCEIYVEGEGGLKAVDTVAVNVVTPQLNLEVLGPKLRYLDKKAVYTLKVTNPGDAPANNVFVTDIVPAGFKFLQADAGGQHDAGSGAVKWFIGEIAPGQSKEVRVELMAVNQGEHLHKVVATGSRGVKTEKEMATKVEGLSAIAMEVTETENPVEVGHDTTFEIRISNSGSKAEEAVKLVCTIPAQMKLKGVNAPVKYDSVGNELVFEPLSKLNPKGDVVFKVTCTATAKGDARFKAAISAASMVEPLIKQESTKIYED